MKTVIEMAREAGIIHPEMVDKTLARFAELACADERNATLEEIAKWLEDEKDAPYWAELVRARNNK